MSNMSIRDINDVYEIRISLDTLAAGLAAERISDEELEELQRLLVKVGNAIEENDMAKVVEADIEFHDVLYKASRNERLRNIINNLREQITVIRGVSMRYPGRLKDTQEEHRRLVESIAARNESGSGPHPSGKCGADADDCHVGAEGRRGAAELPGGQKVMDEYE